MDVKDLAPGKSVRLHDLNAAWLNGLVGTLVQLDESNGRWQVDLGKDVGVKALQPKNLALHAEDEGEEEEEQEPGNWIDRLLGSDGQGKGTKQSDELDEIDAIAEGIDEDDMHDDNVFDSRFLEEEDIEPEEEKPDETGPDEAPPEEEDPQEEAEQEAEPEEADPEEDEPPEEEREEVEEPMESEEVPPEEDDDLHAAPEDVDQDENNEHEHPGDEEYDPEELPAEEPPDVEEVLDEEPEEAEEPPDFTKMTVKELKEFLKIRAVRIPAWVTEKSDLLDLVKDSASLPVRPPVDPKESEKAEEEKGAPAETKEDNLGPAAEKKEEEETADHSKPWQAPGGQGPGQGWSYTAPRAPIPGPVGFGPHWAPTWGGCLNPPAFNPWMRPPGFGAPYHPRPPAQSQSAPAPRAPWPPKSRDEAMSYQAYRIRNNRHSQGTKDRLREFCKTHRFSIDVETVLSMLDESMCEYMLNDRMLIANMEKSSNPHQVLLDDLTRKRDPSVATIMRWLAPPVQRTPTRSPKRASVRLKSRDRSRRRSRSRSRRRGRHRRPSSPRRKSPRRGSPGRRSSPRWGSPQRRSHPRPRTPPPKPERRKEQRRSPSPSRIVVPMPKSKLQGVFRSPSPSPSPSHPPAAAAPSTNSVNGQADLEGDVKSWLTKLDSGRGALAPYAKAIVEEFGSVPALSACVLPDPPKGSVIGRIDSALWDTLEVKSLGHRLLLAKGILALD